MLVDDYAKATAVLIEEGKEKEANIKHVLASLDRVLAHRGHEKLKGRILRELVRMLERMREGHATLMLADEADAQKLKAEIAEASKKLNASDTDIVVDPTLIGGFVLRTKTAQLDQSYKSTLLNLYRSIVTNR